jgi:hypothetical protein
MRRAVLLVIATLALPASVGAAVFTSKPYDSEVTTSSGPFSWTFASSEHPDPVFGTVPVLSGVAYKLSTESTWHRCLQDGYAGLSQVPPGTYTITIADDYNPAVLAKYGDLSWCTGALPVGGNEKTDSVTSTGIPLPENKILPYENKLSPETIQHDVEAAKRNLARSEAEGLKIEEERIRAARAVAKARRCTVPELVGDSLGGARVLLARAHCRLGRVSRPRGHDGTLVVRSQSLGHGEHCPRGTAVAVRLGLAHGARG